MADTSQGSSRPQDERWASQSSDLIRFKQFATTRRGFDPDEVREYLAQAATWFDEAKRYLSRLERERRELLAQREALMQSQVSSESDPYQQLAARMADVLRAVDQHAQTLRREVDEDARRQSTEAEQQAEQIRAEAEQQAGQVRAEAEAGASRVREEAARFAREVRTRAEELRDRMASHRMSVQGELRGLLERTRRITEELEGQIGALEGDSDGGDGGPAASEGEPVAEAVEEAQAQGDHDDPMLSYASDDLLIVLPDLVPALDEQEDDRS